MATYAIGDLQGCFTTFERLLRRIDWNKRRDRLWLAGDLVNRGPSSLEVLRFVSRLGDAAISVLGNHDLHLLMVDAGLRALRAGDTLQPILAARDRRELIAWLRRRPLVHRERGFLLVHGGLWPSWSPAEAEQLSRQASASLAAGNAALTELAAGASDIWEPHLRGARRIAAAMRIMTSLRMLDADGEPIRYSGPPEEAPRGAVPWYEYAGRRSTSVTVVFGHWAAHDFAIRRGAIALDSGCVWGRRLTAVRLDDLAVFQEPAADGAATD